MEIPASPAAGEKGRGVRGREERRAITPFIRQVESRIGYRLDDAGRRIVEELQRRGDSVDAIVEAIERKNIELVKQWERQNAGELKRLPPHHRQ